MTEGDDPILPEYDFAALAGGVRGKYAARLKAGSNLILIDEEIARAFPSSDAVNAALRGLLAITRAVREEGGLAEATLSKKTTRRSGRGRRGQASVTGG